MKIEDIKVGTKIKPKFSLWLGYKQVDSTTNKHLIDFFISVVEFEIAKIDKLGETITLTFDEDYYTSRVDKHTQKCETVQTYSQILKNFKVVEYEH